MENWNDHFGTKFDADFGHVIDKEVKLAFRPINVMQNLLLNPRYQIKNNVILPNNHVHKSLIILMTLILAIMYTFRFVRHFILSQGVGFFAFGTTFEYSFRSAGLLMNLLIHFKKTKRSVEFVLYFQEVHRFLKQNSVDEKFLKQSWIGVACIFGIYCIILGVIVPLLIRPPWDMFINILVRLSLDINIIYALRLMKLLTDTVRLWNAQLLIAQKVGCSRLHSASLFRAYVQILKCYEIILDVYKGPFFYQVIDVLFQSLIDIKTLITLGKQGTNAVPILVYISSWIIKSMIIQFALSLTFDTFYETVHLAQISCLLNSFENENKCTDYQRRICKNVTRLHRASFSKLRVCGMFYIDVCHLLRLMLLLTNYTVVMLQFAFL